MPELAPEAATELEAAADHFAEVAHACDDEARSYAATTEELAHIEAEIPLSPELAHWYRYRGPAALVTIEQLGNDRKIYPPHELVGMQLGYRWVALPNSRRGTRIEDWPTSWMAIGDEGADPIIAHTDQCGTPISYSMHGMGQWQLHPLAPSLATYLKAQARWMYVCLLNSGAARKANWGAGDRTVFDRDRIWDDDGEYLPPIAETLRYALSPILPEDCLHWWL